ncbi:hypothetical protein PG987_003729 [Apiospora arundinis]
MQNFKEDMMWEVRKLFRLLLSTIHPSCWALLPVNYDAADVSPRNTQRAQCCPAVRGQLPTQVGRPEGTAAESRIPQ